MVRKNKLLIILFCLLAGTQAWAVKQNAPDDGEKQEQNYLYLKALIDEMEDPKLDKSNGQAMADMTRLLCLTSATRSKSILAAIRGGQRPIRQISV